MPGVYNGNYANQAGFAAGTAVTGTASALAGAATQITSVAHGLQTNDLADLSKIGGTVFANAEWQVTRVDANNFTIPLAWASAGGAWTSGGHVQPIVFPVAYAPVIDNDDPTGANFAAASTYPSADRDTLLLASTGAFKLAARYDDWWWNAGSQGSNSISSVYWSLALTGITINTWAAVNSLGGTFSGVPAGFTAAWPYTGGPSNSNNVLQTQVGDFVEVEWSGTVIYNPGVAAKQMQIAIGYSNQSPGVSPSYVRAPGGAVIITDAAADSVQQTVTLKSIFQSTKAGPLAFNLMEWHNDAAGVTDLEGDYTFGVKIWRVTAGVPQ